MKKLVLFFTILLSANLSFAYEMIKFAEKDSNVVVVEKDVDNTKKYGLIDFYTREVILPLEYRHIDVEFKEEGLAVVCQDKCGYIDKSGRIVISLQYDDANPFSEGLALVEKAGKKAFIDKNGRNVIPIPSKYNWVHWFSDGLATVCNSDRLCGYIDKSGKEVIPMINEMDEMGYIGSFKDGIALVTQNEKYVYINKTGKIAISSKVGKSFNEGLAVFCQERCGYIDNRGKIIIPLKYEVAWRFNEGLAEVCQENKCGYIDKSGKIVIPLKYDMITCECDTNPDDPDYDYLSVFKDGLAMISQNGKSGFIDKSGKIVIPLIYDEVSYLGRGIVRVKKDDKYTLIDTKTGEVFD